MKSHLECVICLQTFKDPKQLPCGHTFCAHCLDLLIGDQQFVDCPSCKAKHLKPGEGFRVDFKANQLLDVLNEVFSMLKLKY